VRSERTGRHEIGEDDSIFESSLVNGSLECLDKHNCIIRNNVVDHSHRWGNGITTKGGTRNAQSYGNVVHQNGGMWEMAIMCGGGTGPQ
jgi:hypothetical protein